MTVSKWELDTVHSTVEFSIKHMMISKAKGHFEDFSANIEADPENPIDAKVEFEIDLNSINTKNEKRDGHLRSADFFDVENHPKAIYKVTSIEHKSGDDYTIKGDFSLLGTTKEVEFDSTFTGQSKDPMSGDIVAGFSAKGKIKREEFGLTWNAALETGGVLLGNDININIELEAHKAE